MKNSLELHDKGQFTWTIMPNELVVILNIQNGTRIGWRSAWLFKKKKCLYEGYFLFHLDCRECEWVQMLKLAGRNEIKSQKIE